jgi:hypothetical protein
MIAAANPGQVLSFEPLRGMLCGRMGDLVPQNSCQPRRLLRHGQDARVDDDLSARQAVGVCDVLAKKGHFPDEGGLVAAGNGLDALRDALHKAVLGAGRDDP